MRSGNKKREIPHFLFVFANPPSGHKQFLAQIEKEKEAIVDLMKKLSAGYHLRYDILEGVTFANFRCKLLDFRKKQPECTTLILHFAGHAGLDFLVLLDESGKPNHAAIHGIAHTIREFGTIDLVVLNGCNTEMFSQVLTSKEIGVPCVIGTTSKLEDRLAATFSEVFYEKLLGLGYTIRDAFDSSYDACHADYTTYIKAKNGYNLWNYEIYDFKLNPISKSFRLVLEPIGPDSTGDSDITITQHFKFR